MKKVLYIAMALTFAPIEGADAVSYQLGARLGDNLISFSHALWISYKQNIPVIYTPFTLGDELRLSQINTSFDLHLDEKHPEIFHMLRPFTIPPQTTSEDHRLFVVPFFPVCLTRRYQFNMDWNDKGFQALLKKHIAPVKPVPLLNLPDNRVHVAVHVRTGGGYDHMYKFRRVQRGTQCVNKVMPYRFPPTIFHIEQII